MDNEQERLPQGSQGQSPEPAPRVRLPGYDELARGRGPAHDGQGYDWPGYDYRPPRGYGGYPPYPREGGLRSARRASTWTVAALIAGVAATTGYLAHSIPVNGTGSTTSGGTKKPATTPAATRPSTPAVNPPVVTSGGSGAAGGAGGGDN
ncbi:MAG TPA: hypothetical protein VF843_14445 [Streptosporangiaceae bacterium]